MGEGRGGAGGEEKRVKQNCKSGGERGDGEKSSSSIPTLPGTKENFCGMGEWGGGKKERIFWFCDIEYVGGKRGDTGSIDLRWWAFMEFFSVRLEIWFCIT